MNEELKQGLEEIKRAVVVLLKNIWNVSELAFVLGVTEGRVRALASEGAFPYYKPKGGKLYFKREEIEAWQTRNRVASNDEIESMAATRCVLSRLKR